MIELQPNGVVLVRAFLAFTLGMLALFAGKALNRRISALREYDIPEPVSGGLVFALLFWVFQVASGYRVTFEFSVRDLLLVYFFITIGLNARISDLTAGGRPLLTLLICIGAFLLLQDGLGVMTATLLGRPMALGLLVGSVSLLGGHGTAIAWAPAFEQQHGISNALEIGVLCSTAGLVVAGLVGGPLAHVLIQRHKLSGPSGAAPEVGLHYGDPPPAIDYFSFLRALFAIHACAVLGWFVQAELKRASFNLPLFVPCLLVAILLGNVLPRLAPTASWPSHTPALALIAEVSLGVFLAMSLMSMQIGALLKLAGPLTLFFVVQVALAVLFAALVIFRALGRNYDAAVTCAGFVGFGLGATPTAMANMTAVTQRYGASHVAFLIVPLAGAFFIDLLNTATIRLFLWILS